MEIYYKLSNKQKFYAINLTNRWERRHRKRKSRLISCTEEVFAQFKATNGTNTNSKVKNYIQRLLIRSASLLKIEPMDPSNVAKAILVYFLMFEMFLQL